MKKLIVTSLLTSALILVPVAHAETVTCSTSQYGGATCGVETTTETVVTHKTVDAGLADWTIGQIALFAGLSAIAATVLYKLTYRSYLFG
jgi:hypothetical protein